MRPGTDSTSLQDRTKEHAVLIRVELKVFCLSHQLAIERRRHAQVIARHNTIWEVRFALVLYRRGIYLTLSQGHMVMIDDDRGASERSRPAASQA